MKSLTVVEEAVLLGIYRLGQNAYSVSIHEEILRMTGKDMIVGTLFNALKQLERKGYLNTQKGKPVHEKGGKTVVFYTVSKEGLLALEQTRTMNSRIWDQIPEVLAK